MFLLNVPQQPFFAECRGVRAILPPTSVPSETVPGTIYPVTIPQMGREVEALNDNTASRASFYPATGVWAKLWRAGDRDQPPGILEKVRNSDGLRAGLTSSVKS